MTSSYVAVFVLDHWKTGLAAAAKSWTGLNFGCRRFCFSLWTMSVVETASLYLYLLLSCILIVELKIRWKWLNY